MVAGGLGIVNVDRSEKIQVIKSIEASEFSEAIVTYDQEFENMRGINDEGLIANRIRIRGVNIYSVQPLYYHLIFWGKRIFAGTHIDDVYLDLHMRKPPTFRIANTGRYYYASTRLDIPYEDDDGTYELHVGLQNLDAVNKLADAPGAVLIYVLYSPRL